MKYNLTLLTFFSILSFHTTHNASHHITNDQDQVTIKLKPFSDNSGKYVIRHHNNELMVSLLTADADDRREITLQHLPINPKAAISINATNCTCVLWGLQHIVHRIKTHGIKAHIHSLDFECPSWKPPTITLCKHSSATVVWYDNGEQIVSHYGKFIPQ